MKQLILFLLCLSTWTAQAKIYNVKDYGAKADAAWFLYRTGTERHFQRKPMVLPLTPLP